MSEWLEIEEETGAYTRCPSCTAPLVPRDGGQPWELDCTGCELGYTLEELAEIRDEFRAGIA